jgi:myosin protein heavy chain
VDGLEEDLRRAREQLAELGRTAADYSKIIKEKEGEVDRARGEHEAAKRERARLHKHVTELEADLETLSLELDESKQTRERDVVAQSKLQKELDQLRALLEAKASEETKRSEVERRKEAELVSLRSEVSKLQRDIADARTTALEAQNRLKVDLDTINREHKSLQHTYNSLLERERGASSKLKEVTESLSTAEKIKRSLESDLQSLRSRQNDTDSHLAEVQRAKEVGDSKSNVDPLTENPQGSRTSNFNLPGEAC